SHPGGVCGRITPLGGHSGRLVSGTYHPGFDLPVVIIRESNTAHGSETKSRARLRVRESRLDRSGAGGSTLPPLGASAIRIGAKLTTRNIRHKRKAPHI